MPKVEDIVWDTPWVKIDSGPYKSIKNFYIRYGNKKNTEFFYETRIGEPSND